MYAFHTLILRNDVNPVETQCIASLRTNPKTYLNTMKRLLFLFLLISPSIWSSLQAQTPLAKFLSAGNLSSAGISVLIRDVESGENLIEHHSNTNRNPASLVKLLTTATAVELLSDTFKFQTRIEYDGVITDSILNGNIYIKGGGDPTLESAYRQTPNNFYVESTKAILDAGIRKINGRVVGDASLFEEYGAPFQWLVEDIGSYYSPTPSALSAHDNIFYLTFLADASSVRLEKIQPPTRLLLPEINFKVGNELSWRVSKADFSWQPIFRGIVPANKKASIRTEIPEPALFVADSLYNLFRTIGIAVDSASTTTRMHNTSGRERTLLYTYYSEPLKNIIKETNYRSLNLYAENIFSYLALQNDSITTATTQAAAGVVSAFWNEKRLPAQRIFQSDGSGLSMKNAINAEFFVQLLIYMRKKGTYGDSFALSLPAAGVSGTVKNFLAGTSLAGKAYVKSGSMERVQNYGGYVFHKNRWYAFCVMVSNYEGDRATVQKQIGTLLNGVFQ